MKSKIIKKIETNREKIKKIGVKKIGLFGSFLKNKEKRNSDVDILVEFDEITADNFFNLLSLLESLFRKKVDLVIESDLKPELKYVKEEAEYVRI